MDQSTNLAASKNGWLAKGALSGFAYFLIKYQWYMKMATVPQIVYLIALPMKNIIRL